jgi:hypothetical protein
VKIRGKLKNKFSKVGQKVRDNPLRRHVSIVVENPF